MGKITRSVSGVFVDGFLVLLPVLISYLLIGGFFDLLLSLTQPFIDLLPATAFRDRFGHQAAAAGALILMTFLAGLASRSAIGRRIGNWTERRVLTKFPPYVVLRSFSRRMFGKDVPDQLQPAVVEVDSGSYMFAFVVEEALDNYMVVFVPLAPTPGVGTLRIVDRKRIRLLDASFSEAIGCLFNWGVGTADLLASHRRSQDIDVAGDILGKIADAVPDEGEGDVPEEGEKQ